MKELNPQQTEQVTGARRFKRPPITTLAVGEEGGVTTLAMGEEGPIATTLALGEENPVITTLALGEEGSGGTFTSTPTSALGSF